MKKREHARGKEREERRGEEKRGRGEKGKGKGAHLATALEKTAPAEHAGQPGVALRR